MKRLPLTAAILGVAMWIPAASIVRAQAAIDPAAMDALNKMGQYLRTLKSFQIEATTTDQDVLDDGEIIEYGGVVTILAQMPNHFRAQVINDRHERMFFYDGKTFTLFAERVNTYASVQAPPTISELASKLDEEYAFSIPLVDLFRWGTPAWDTSGITGATDVGPSNIDGTTCEQFAFRQADVDWQIWIQKGDYPLPRKIVIINKADESRPRHSAIYKWNLAPSFNEAAFTFNAPEGAARIVLAKVPAGGQR